MRRHDISLTISQLHLDEGNNIMFTKDYYGNIVCVQRGESGDQKSGRAQKAFIVPISIPASIRIAGSWLDGEKSFVGMVWIL